MEKANDLDAKIQKMQAPLEEWVEHWSVSQEQSNRDIDIYCETKAFLKEAKEVKHGN